MTASQRRSGRSSAVQAPSTEAACELQDGVVTPPRGPGNPGPAKRAASSPMVPGRASADARRGRPAPLGRRGARCRPARRSRRQRRRRVGQRKERGHRHGHLLGQGAGEAAPQTDLERSSQTCCRPVTQRSQWPQPICVSPVVRRPSHDRRHPGRRRRQSRTTRGRAAAGRGEPRGGTPSARRTSPCRCRRPRPGRCRPRPHLDRRLAGRRRRRRTRLDR